VSEAAQLPVRLLGAHDGDLQRLLAEAVAADSRLCSADGRGDGAISAGAPDAGADLGAAESSPGAAAADAVIGLVGWRAATRAELVSLSELRARHPGPLVAVVAELPSARGARALAARLEGSLLAAELDTALWPTLEAVAAGQCVVPRVVRQLVDRPPLSPRERQILAMVVLDFSNAEIARKLFVTESNVKGHLSSAFDKLGVKSRNAAAELILDPESGLGPGILRISAEEALPGEGRT
jgi:DNA-binding NarL/FixJ family response regulator